MRVARVSLFFYVKKRSQVQMTWLCLGASGRFRRFSFGNPFPISAQVASCQAGFLRLYCDCRRERRMFFENLFRGSSVVERMAVKAVSWCTVLCMPEKKRKDTRKYADRAEYIKRSVAKCRKAMRLRAIEYKGGRCSRCSYDRCYDALEFHHIDRRKDFGISEQGLTRSWERIKDEIEKCILICANCHREEHARIRSLSEKSESET